MNRLVALLVLVLGVCAGPARAALVYDGYATGPGGLSTPYPSINPEVYAGFIEMHIGGTTVLAMSDDYNARSNVGESWPMTLYTYADVMAGAPVRFSPDRYSSVAWDRDVFRNLFSGFSWTGATSLVDALRIGANLYPDTTTGLAAGLAFENQGVWAGMNPSLSFPSWPYGTGCWDGINIIADYSNCPSSIRTYDWSNDMVVASGGPGRDEYLIPLAGQNFTLASGTVTLGPVVPLPPAAWLLGSGLLGLVGVARKKHKAPH